MCGGQLLDEHEYASEPPEHHIEFAQFDQLFSRRERRKALVDLGSAHA